MTSISNCIPQVRFLVSNLGMQFFIYQHHILTTYLNFHYYSKNDLIIEISYQVFIYSYQNFADFRLLILL